MKPRVWLPLLGLLLLTLLQRGAVYSAPRVDLLGIYAGAQNAASEGIVVGEERARINSSLDLIEGKVMPLIDYQYANYCGGSLVVSLLMVPLVHWMGPTIWVLRAFALLGNLLALVFLYAILQRWASRRAALFGCLLWALASPGLLINTMIVWGTHVESNVLALATVWLFLSLQTSEQGRTGKRWLLGALEGLNFYIGYQTVLVIAMLGFFDLHPKRFPKAKEWFAQLAGFVVGIAPWLWYNLRNHFEGFRIYGYEGTENLSAEGALGKLKNLYTSDLPTAQWFQKPFPALGETLNGFYLTVVLAMALWGVLACWLGRRDPARRAPNPGSMAGIYLLGFSAMYALTRFGVTPNEDVIGYRYPLIAMPWLILAAGVGFDRLAALGTVSRALAWVGGLCLAGLSAAASVPGLVDVDRLGVERHLPANDPASHTLWMFSSHRAFPERYPELVHSIQRQRSPEQFERMLLDLFQKTEWLAIDQPGFAPNQLEFAAQLRTMRSIVWKELPPALQAKIPEPVAP